MNVSIMALSVCGNCVAPQKWITYVHRHSYRLYFVRGGKVYFRVGDKEIKLQKNCFYLFPSSLPFLVRQDPDDRLDHLYYNFIMSPPLIASEPIVCSLDEHPLLPSFLLLMENSVEYYQSHHEKAYKNTAKSILEAFLSFLFTIKPFPTTIDRDILTSVKYIESHYPENLTMRDLAAQACLDENYFIRKFRKTLGVTPYSYLLNLRLGIAAEMRDLGATSSEAALAVGFQHTSSYHRALKRHLND